MSRKTLQQKLDNFYTACDHQTPEWVPIAFDASSYAVAYAGKKLEDLFKNPVDYVESISKLYRDLDIDCATNVPDFFLPITVTRALGSDMFVIAEDGVTIQHTVQHDMMRDDEYEQFIADPNGYSLEVLARRKFTALQGTKEEFKQSAVNAMNELKMNMGRSHLMQQKFDEMEVFNCWAFIPNVGLHPLDQLFNFTRGFKGLLADMRRRPEKIEAAMEAILQPALQTNIAAAEKVKEANGRPGFIHGHSFTTVAFMNFKQFERFYWPIFNKLMAPFVEAGGKFMIKSEGYAGHFLKYFVDFPKSTFIFQLDNDNPYDYVDLFESHLTYAGGTNLNTLKFASQQECIDEVKRAMDTFAPGGGYIFMPQKALATANDAKIENLKAVYQFAREYGKY